MKILMMMMSMMMMLKMMMIVKMMMINMMMMKATIEIATTNLSYNIDDETMLDFFKGCIHFVNLSPIC